MLLEHQTVRFFVCSLFCVDVQCSSIQIQYIYNAIPHWIMLNICFAMVVQTESKWIYGQSICELRETSENMQNQYIEEKKNRRVNWTLINKKGPKMKWQTHHTEMQRIHSRYQQFVIYSNAMLVSNGFFSFSETVEFTHRTVKHQHQRNIPEAHDIWDANECPTILWVEREREREKNRKWWWNEKNKIKHIIVR